MLIVSALLYLLLNSNGYHYLACRQEQQHIVSEKSEIRKWQHMKQATPDTKKK